jgi:YebC/PmpR family DNA-binding regulatory protein
MAGHSHSSNIRFRKDRVDAKRAKAFAKLSRMITVAARQGGSLDGNAKLRLVVDKARVLSMPKDAIERAIKKGTGEGDLGHYEEVVYEGYGPGGAALVLESLTDNRHRTAADVRMLLEKYGGNLGTTGSVGFLFERRGRFVLDPQPKRDAKGREIAPSPSEAEWFDVAIEVGADDLQNEGFQNEGQALVMLCQPTAFAAVQAALLQRAVPLREAGLAYVPTTRVELVDLAAAQRMMKLVDALEDHDDVHAVYSNEAFPDAIVQALEADS